MRHRQSVQDRCHDCSDCVWRHRSALTKEFTQGSTVDEFHHEEHVIAIAALVVDGHKGRMLESGHGPGLELETSQERWIAGELRVHHLDRDRSIQPCIEASIHGRHTAARDRCVHSIAALEHFADQPSTSVMTVPPCLRSVCLRSGW